MKNRLALILILLFTTVVNAAGGSGGHGGSSSGGPGEHGGSGGGDFFTPSEQQVIDSVSIASLLLLEAHLDFLPVQPTGKRSFGKLVPEEVQVFFSDEYDNALITTILMDGPPEKPYSKIDFIKKGQCPGTDGKSHAGSVTYPKGKLQLCISLEKLTSLPKDYLAQEMAILLSHEMTHFASPIKDPIKQEAQAKAVQEWFSNYNKVRLDIGLFTVGKPNQPSSALMMRAGVKTLNTKTPEEICKGAKSLDDYAYDIDREIKFLRLNSALNFFKIDFPSENDNRYWLTRISNVVRISCEDQPDLAVLKKQIDEFATEYETFINQFGISYVNNFYR